MVKVNKVSVSNDFLVNLSTRNIQHLDMNYCPVVNNKMEGSFCNNQNIVSVSNVNSEIMEMIGDGTYGYGTFSNCSNLTGAPDLSACQNIIDMQWTFSNCNSLTDTPNLPESIYGLSLSGTFEHCYGLLNVTSFPNNVLSMSQTFQHCENLVNVPSIPNSVASMSDTFWSCYNLVNGPDISNCSNLTDIWRIYGQCYNLASVSNIPNSVTNMGSTFFFCENLVDVPVIPNSVTDMSSTFQGCSSLVDAPEIPDSVINMSHTFFDCMSLVNANTISNSVVNMRSTYNDCYALVNIPSEIPSVTEDMRSAFCNCWNITSTPDMSNATNLKDIAGAYWNCVNLTTVSNVPANITDMGWCFEYCNNISSDIIIQSEKVFEATGAVYGNNINVYIPFNMSSSLDYTQWYCWLDGNDNKYYTPVDFYNMSQGSGWMVYNEDIRDENFNWISGDIQYNGEYYTLHVWGEQYIETEINYSSANNVVIHKNAGDSSFTYDSFVNAGYSTSDYVNGVILKDLATI